MSKIENTIYSKWYHSFLNDFTNIKYLYIKTNPKVCYDRIIKRKRQGEDKIKIEYLEMCKKYHDDWLNNKEPIIFDGDYDLENNQEEVKKIIAYLYTL